MREIDKVVKLGELASKKRLVPYFQQQHEPREGGYGNA